jgi:hypothetical protein
MKGMWQKAADRIRETLGQVSFETWIGPLGFVAMHSGTSEFMTDLASTLTSRV